MTLGTAVAIGAIIGLILTVVLCIMVVPEKKRSTLNNKFLVVLHDIFNFKDLLLEKIIKVLYVLTTVACVCIGFFMLFSSNRYYDYYYGTYIGGQSYFLPGLLLMVLGPIVLRITYEFMMLTILLVKNVIDINKKLKAPEAPVAPKAPVAPAEPVVHEEPKAEPTVE